MRLPADGRLRQDAHSGPDRHCLLNRFDVVEFHHDSNAYRTLSQIPVDLLADAQVAVEADEVLAGEVLSRNRPLARQGVFGMANQDHLLAAQRDDAQVGLAHNIRFFDPADPKRIRDRAVAWLQDLWFNRSTLAAVWQGWWLPPLGFGPALGVRRTLDWVGLNYYTRDLVAFDRKGDIAGLARTMHDETAEPLDGGYGELYPEGLSRALKQLALLKLPIHITENGIPDADDDQRPRALLLHLHQLWRAIQNNVPVKSYYHWTLVDNFEWAKGWTLPFGLIQLDPQTQTRTPRPSGDLYAAIARGNAITPELLDAYAPELRPSLLPD